MNSWKKIRLRDVAKYITDKTDIKNIDTSNYISTENMVADRRGVIAASSLPNLKLVNSYKVNDILVSNIRPYFKKIWLAIFSGGCSADVLVVRGNAYIGFKYLYYILSNDRFFDFSLASAKGTKMPRGDKNRIMEYPIFLPPLAEQEAIAGVLSSLDDKIELNNKINKTLEEMAQAIFKHWFIDFEFPNDKGLPYKSSGGEFINSELGKIPKGWKVGKLGDIADITSGKRPLTKSEIKTACACVQIVGASSVMGYTDRVLLNQKVLITGRVGTHGVIQRFNEPIWASDNVLVITSDNYEYVYQILLTINFANMNRGSTQPLITLTDLKQVNIILPNAKLLCQFENMLLSFMDYLSSNNIENLTLSSLRDTLLPKLMSGEIRVKK